MLGGDRDAGREGGCWEYEVFSYLTGYFIRAPRSSLEVIQRFNAKKATTDEQKNAWQACSLQPRSLMTKALEQQQPSRGRFGMAGDRGTGL